MANINLGKVALNTTGGWDSTTTYEKLDIVSYQGNSYIAKQNVPSGVSVTTGTNYWQLLAEKGETGTSVGDVIIASSTQPYQEENKLWIREGSDEEVEVLTVDDIDDSKGESDTDYVWSADKTQKAFYSGKMIVNWEQGRISYVTGSNASSSYAIRTRDYIPVTPGEIFYFDRNLLFNVKVIYYDSSKTFVSSEISVFFVTIPSNISYMRISYENNDTSVTNVTVADSAGLFVYRMSSDIGNAISLSFYQIPYWEANTEYVIGDRVKYQSSYYVCKTDHTSGSSFSSVNWYNPILIYSGMDSFKERIILYASTSDPTIIPNGEFFYYITTKNIYKRLYNKSYLVLMNKNTVYELDGVDYSWDNDNHILRSKNQYNWKIICNWEQGRISPATGSDVSSSYAIRTIDYIPVKEGDEFYYERPLTFEQYYIFYDENKAFLSSSHWTAKVPEGAEYMRISYQKKDLTPIDIEADSKNVNYYKVNSDIGMLNFPEIIPIPDWEPNTEYIVGKRIKNENKYYVCKTAHTSEDTFSPDNWSANVGRFCTEVKANINHLKIDRVSGVSYDVSEGEYYYFTTLHSIYKKFEVPELVQWRKGVTYELDGLEFIWDEESCNLVPKDQNIECKLFGNHEIAKAGYSISKTGSTNVASAYNISKPLEINPGDYFEHLGYASGNVAVIAETDASGSYYKPLIIGDERTGTYRFKPEKHMFIACTVYYTGSRCTLYHRKDISFTQELNWEMQGFYNQYGIIQMPTVTAGYSLSVPIKLYEGDRIKIKCYAVANDPIILKFFDRWNTYWASTLGKSQAMIIPNSTGENTYTCMIPETGYYIVSCNVTNKYQPEMTVTRSAYMTEIVDALEIKDSLENHNYVDKYDYVPDLVSRRTNSIMTYAGDNKKSSNYIANAVAYPNGEIIACRAGGDVVKIANDGTETVLLNIPYAQDWRGVFMDSNLNVYVSPHSSSFPNQVSATNRGLYKLSYGANSFEKVISLCRSTTEIKRWKSEITYNVGDIVFKDRESTIYKCNESHTSGSEFDPDKWDSFPNWATSTEYSVGDIVIYNDCYFRCMANHTSGASYDYSKWAAATEFMSNDDTIWTICEDEKGNVYAGVYSHLIRANPAVYRCASGETTFQYIHNFIMNRTLPESIYDSQVMHVHCINFNPYDNTLYAAVGEVNTIVKSADHGMTWTDMHTPSYYGQPTYVLGVKDGLVIGSDGHYSCGVSKIYTDGKTVKLCGRTAPGFIFNIRRSDITGWLYAWTRIDNIVGNLTRCPPYEAIDDPEALESWIENDASPAQLRFWTRYHEWALKYYPEDAVRPQNAVIMVSRDEGETWEVFYKVKVSQNNSSICGFITVGYFRDGECLSGLLRPIEGTTEGMAFVQPIIISEGKKKRTSSGYDLTGEIFIKTNNSNIVSY